MIRNAKKAVATAHEGKRLAARQRFSQLNNRGLQACLPRLP
jgi:hypothetical protein